MNRRTDPSRPAAPSVREITALTARLREITSQGRDADPAERERFLADKEALIARITATEADRSRAAVRERYEAQDELTDAVRVSAEHPGYVMVGPSARTWLRDPVTGQPSAPASEHEHRAVRELLQREELDTTEPAWVTGPDGQSDVHSVVYPIPHTEDDASGAGRDVEEMPEWMREQARATEAEIAAGTYEPGPPDDRERIAARLVEIRAAAEAAATDAADLGAPGRDDPVWWATTGPDEVALSHQEVAAELAERGFGPEQARAAISGYLDETSDRIGVSVHQWAMDSHDVEAIAHTHRPPVPVPEQRHPGAAEQGAGAEQSPTQGGEPRDYAGERDDWEQVRGGDPRSYEQMMGDAAGALTRHRAGRPADAEGARREQLVRWHTDDTTAGGPDRGEDGDVIGSEFDDEAVIFEGRRW